MTPCKAVADKIRELLGSREQVVVAIDGRCASGKTTLAKQLSEELLCNVFHMDDFFLRPEQRTPQRLSLAGENVDHERFLSEVLLHLRSGEPFSYRPYSCKTGQLSQPVAVSPCRVNIVEGSYSCHKSLWDFYDLHVFLDVKKEFQLDRILERNGKESLEVFRNKWIPLEEKYFETFDIENRCEMKFYMN